MKERLRIVQLRSTIFVPQNFGYTPETANEFRVLLLPEANVYGIAQPGIPMLGVNPTMPQYGLSWRLFKKVEGEGEYNIAFQPGKIDIVLSKDAPYEESIEQSFCKKCISMFNKILSKHQGLVVQRIAYAPLYAISRGNDNNNSDFWGIFLRKTAYNGLQTQDVSLQFLLKQLINFEGTEIQMNLLHQIFDGKQTKKEDGNLTVNNVLLIQLDLNSVPEKILNLKGSDIEAFYNGILEVKNRLINNVEL